MFEQIFSKDGKKLIICTIFVPLKCFKKRKINMTADKRMDYHTPELELITLEANYAVCVMSTGESFSGQTDYSSDWEEED